MTDAVTERNPAALFLSVGDTWSDSLDRIAISLFLRFAEQSGFS